MKSGLQTFFADRSLHKKISIGIKLLDGTKLQCDFLDPIKVSLIIMTVQFVIMNCMYVVGIPVCVCKLGPI